MPDVHVVPSGNLWAFEIDGHIRSTHETQEEAIKVGRGLAEDQNGELVVHAQDGSIREKASHGNDPQRHSRLTRSLDRGRRLPERARHITWTSSWRLFLC